MGKNNFNKQFQFEVFRKEGFSELVDLFKIVWPETNYFNRDNKTTWAFDRKDSLVIVARDVLNNKLVGARGSMFWPLTYNAKHYHFFQFHSTCVHPDYRRMGIFSRMNRFYLSKLKEVDGHGVFNISVNESMQGYKKIGWKYLSGFQKLMYFPKPLNLISKIGFNINKLAGHANYLKFNEDAPLSNELHLKMIADRDSYLGKKDIIHTWYDSDTLKWRLSAKSGNYRYINCENSVLVYKIGIKNDIREVLLGEIFTGNDFAQNDFRCILNSLIKREHPDMISVYITKKHPLYPFYRKFFFIPNYLKKDINFGVRVLDNNLNARFLNASNWALSTMDLDTF